MEKEKAHRFIFEKLAERIRVAVEWDGYTDGKNAEAWDVAVETATNTTFKKVCDRVEQDFAGESEARDKFKALTDGFDKLFAEIEKYSMDIVKHARYMKQDIEKIPSTYFDVAARKFENSKKELCVLLSNAPWFP